MFDLNILHIPNWASETGKHLSRNLELGMILGPVLGKIFKIACPVYVWIGVRVKNGKRAIDCFVYFYSAWSKTVVSPIGEWTKTDFEHYIKKVKDINIG